MSVHFSTCFNQFFFHLFFLLNADSVMIIFTLSNFNVIKCVIYTFVLSYKLVACFPCITYDISAHTSRFILGHIAHFNNQLKGALGGHLHYDTTIG